MSKPKQDAPSILKAMRSIEQSTEVSFSSISQVRKAFLFGLWYRSFPDYMLEHLTTLYTWDLKEIAPELAVSYDAPPNSFKFQFISDTGDSWHQCYRDLRKLGWQRQKVHRDGGLLQYLFTLQDTWLGFSFPEGYRELTLLLDISISTCKQIQIGTEMKEVPIMKTVCEDLAEEPAEEMGERRRTNEYPNTDKAVTELVVIPDVEAVITDSDELNRRRALAKSEFEDRAAEAFQDAADSYLPDPPADDDKDPIPF